MRASKRNIFSKKEMENLTNAIGSFFAVAGGATRGLQSSCEPRSGKESKQLARRINRIGLTK